MTSRLIVALIRDTPEAPERLLGRLRRLQVRVRSLSLRRHPGGGLEARARLEGSEERMRRVRAELTTLPDLLSLRGPEWWSPAADRGPDAG